MADNTGRWCGKAKDEPLSNSNIYTILLILGESILLSHYAQVPVLVRDF